MAICNECNDAIRTLALQGHGRSGGCEVLYPPWRPAHIDNCWICSKLFQWLEKKHPGLLDRWRQQTMKTRIQLINGIYGGTGPSLLSINLCPFGVDKLDGCEIEVDFINAEDYANITPLGLAPRNKIHCNYRVIRSWIGQCSKHHKDCSSPGVAAWFPSRLLKLDSRNDSMKLILTKDEPPQGPYLTLSHRWGSLYYEKLTSNTIQKFQTAINIARLPQSFQDTIVLTRRLGIRYVWIDSLCIKQDKDLVDWKAEAPNMHRVYSHSFLNVSASLAESGDEALFCQEPFKAFYPSQIDLDIGGLPKTFFVADGDMWKDEVDEASLQKRGWVFQERLLAPRVLHFGRRQIGWECKELTALELFPNGLPRVLLPQSKSQMTSLVLQVESPSYGTPFHKAWHEMVSRYSQCNLSEPRDKLVAFSGVAQMIEGQRADKYLAGLWSSTLIYDLAWYRNGSDSLEHPAATTSPRAPSWSWMSVEGEIFFPSVSGSMATHFLKILKCPESNEVGSTVISASGHIQVEGLILPLNPIRWSHGLVTQFEVAGFQFNNSYGPESSHLDLESSEKDAVDMIRQQNLFFVPLFANDRSIFAILLSKDSGVETYRRAGAAQIQVFGRPTETEGVVSAGQRMADSNVPSFPLFYKKTAFELLTCVMEAWMEGNHRQFNII